MAAASLFGLRRRCACLALGLALGSFAAKAEDGRNGSSYSYYLISCGAFIQHREGGTAAQANNSADTYYVAGWLSAYNRLKSTNAIPEDTTLDDVMLWLEGYCTDNPLSNVETGLFQLSREVMPRNADAAAPEPKPPAPRPVAPPPHVPVEGLRPLPY